MSYVQLLIHGVIRTYKSENTLPTDDHIKFLYKDLKMSIYLLLKNGIGV